MWNFKNQILSVLRNWLWNSALEVKYKIETGSSVLSAGFYKTRFVSLKQSETSDFVGRRPIFPALNSIDTAHKFHSFSTDMAGWLCWQLTLNNNVRWLIKVEQSDIYRWDCL